MSRIVRLVVVMFAVSALLIAFTTPSWSRPGGGSSFRSGSSSGSSYRSGSSSSSSGSSYRSGSSSSSSGSSYRSTSSSSSSSSSGSTYRSTSSSSTSSSSGYHSSTSSSSGYYGGSTSTSSGVYIASSSSSGDAYSGSSSPSGSSNPGFEPSAHKSVFRTLFVAILILLAVIGGVYFWFRWQASRETADWEAAMAEEDEEREAHVRETRHASVQDALNALRAEDDAFSAVLFEDFAYALYASAHTHRGARTLDQLAPYLSDAARKTYAAYPAQEVSAIVVGGMRVESVTTHSKRVQVELVFTSNMAEKDDHGKTRAYYMEEKWLLVRDAGVKSRPPEKARVIGCPHCGAPLDKTLAAKCGYCGAVATAGETDWWVESIDVGSREERGPMLTGTTEEVGTDWPTVVARDAKREMELLVARDPSFQWREFVKRVEYVFHAFHRSWVAQELKGVRPFLSDNLYELQQYWVAAYQAQHLRNVTENPTVVTVHLAKVSRDKYFESITVRVFASCVDYTVDGSGAVVGGRKDATREYTEYWTFIRGVGKSGPRVVRSVDACPSCGAPVADIEMSGKCPHCNAKVTSGEFDWVLSRIEQDEVYDRVA